MKRNFRPLYFVAVWRKTTTILMTMIKRYALIALLSVRAFADTQLCMLWGNQCYDTDGNVVLNSVTARLTDRGILGHSRAYYELTVNNDCSQYDGLSVEYDCDLDPQNDHPNSVFNLKYYSWQSDAWHYFGSLDTSWESRSLWYNTSTLENTGLGYWRLRVCVETAASTIGDVVSVKLIGITPTTTSTTTRPTTTTTTTRPTTTTTRPTTTTTVPTTTTTRPTTTTTRPTTTTTSPTTTTTTAPTTTTTRPTTTTTRPTTTTTAPTTTTTTISDVRSLCYGFEIWPSSPIKLVSFYTDTPTVLNTIGQTSISGSDFIAGAAFLNGDFNQIYGLVFGANTLVKVNTANAAVTVVAACTPATGQSWTGMAVDPVTGTLYASAHGTASALYTINPATGAATLVGPITGSTLVIGIAINAAGQMYGLDLDSDSLISINKATGTATIVGSIGYDANYAQDLAFDLQRNVLYVAAYNNTTSKGELRTCDTQTGSTTLIGLFSNGEIEIDGMTVVGGSSPTTTTTQPTTTTTSPTTTTTTRPTTTSTTTLPTTTTTSVVPTTIPMLRRASYATLVDRISSIGEIDWYAFTTYSDAHRYYTIKIISGPKKSGPLTDSVVSLYGPDTMSPPPLFTDDDGGPKRMSRISKAPLQASKTYYISVKGYSTNTGEYKVKVVRGPKVK